MRNGWPVSSIRISLPPETAHRFNTAGCQRYESLARSRDMMAKSGPKATRRERLFRSVMELTMTAFTPGMVCSISRFHLMVRCGGARTRMRLKPAA